ncbi:MAG TPA: GAF domain-containing protein, partial [Bryobacteraceae bacterium]
PRGSALALVIALGCLPVSAQTRLSLQEVGLRDASADFLPVHHRQKVSVAGTVNSVAFHFPGYSLLAIDDGKFGAVLQLNGTDLHGEAFRPGDRVEAVGTVEALFGAVVIQADRLSKVGQTQPPLPKAVSVKDLLGFQNLGRLVRIETQIIDFGDTANGGYLVADAPGSYKIFIPSPLALFASLKDFRGKTVSVTGVAYQFCTRPPYNHNYQLLVNDLGVVTVKEPNRFPSPLTLAIALSLMLFVGFILWSRERRLSKQRELLRKTYKLGEEILGATSAAGILKRLVESLPGILGITRVHLYVYNRSGKTLDTITDDNREPASISLSAPPGGPEAGAVACFHYRTLLVIPDIDRSPFPMAEEGSAAAPRSLLFVPMHAQSQVVGVMELDQDDRVRDFSPDEQELAQHLGNQIGVALRLLDQRSVQEQLFRSEKLAAVGRLISGVVNELQTPLASISDLAARAIDRVHIGSAEREVMAIDAEARKAAAMVARLVSFASAEQEARPVSISALLRTLIEFREGDWKATGIRVRDLTTREPMSVLGSQGQLEQVFLNLLVHAEQSLAEAPQKTITIRTSVLAKRLLVEIAFTAPPESRSPEEVAAVLGVTRSVIAGHGGEVRLIEKNNTDPRFEVELPAIGKDRSITSTVSAPAGYVPETSRRMSTVLVIEPDEVAQRQILALLSTRGCRVVPVNNSDTGLDLSQRMRFDMAFCSVHAPGLNWVELSERMSSRVGCFILLSDGYDAELSADFEGDGRFVLAKPVQEAELQRVFRTMDSPSMSAPRTA